LSHAFRGQLVPWRRGRQSCGVDEDLIYRREVTALVFGVSDIVASLGRIEILLGGGERGCRRGS
jgi:hypothetical protein